MMDIDESDLQMLFEMIDVARHWPLTFLWHDAVGLARKLNSI